MDDSWRESAVLATKQPFDPHELEMKKNISQQGWIISYYISAEILSFHLTCFQVHKNPEFSSFLCLPNHWQSGAEPQTIGLRTSSRHMIGCAGWDTHLPQLKKKKKTTLKNKPKWAPLDVMCEKKAQSRLVDLSSLLVNS